MAENARTIVLKGDLGDRYEEAKVASGQTIKPGMLIDLNSSGEAIVFNTAGGDTVTRVAIEDALQGRTVDDAYAAGEVIRYFIPRPGDVLNLLVADGENIAIGDKIIASTGGKFIETTGTPTKIFGEAEEALNLSGGASEDKLVRVRIY
jgi:hypothetical protein